MLNEKPCIKEYIGSKIISMFQYNHRCSLCRNSVKVRSVVFNLVVKELKKAK